VRESSVNFHTSVCVSNHAQMLVCMYGRNAPNK
jgi:hypothetical protein